MHLWIYHPSNLLVLTGLTKWISKWGGEGAMEHWKVLSLTKKNLTGRQEKFSKCRRSRIAKTIIFWPWWQPFDSLCFETLSFSPFSPFYSFCYEKKWVCVCGRGEEFGAWPPRPPLCCRLSLIKICLLCFKKWNFARLKCFTFLWLGKIFVRIDAFETLKNCTIDFIYISSCNFLKTVFL